MQSDLAQKQTELEAATAAELASNEALSMLKQTLPEKEAALRAANDLAQKSQQALSEANQRIQIENSNINYLNQSMSEASASFGALRGRLIAFSHAR